MRRVLPLLLVSLAGCGGGEADPEPEVRTTPQRTPVATAGTATCGNAVPQRALKVPKGLILPEAKVLVGKVTRVPPQIRVEGYVEASPGEVRQDFLRDDSLKVRFSEDEGFEAEALITDGRHQNFWKVAKACDRGSAFAAIVVSEKDVPGR